MRRMIATIARTWPGALIGVVGSAVVFSAVLRSGGRPSVLWAADFDPRLVLWIVEWGYHALFETGDWRGFFNANSFYPHARTLAYSENMLSLQLLYAPLRALGVDRLDALYVSLAGFTVLGTTLSYAALNRIGEFLGGGDASLSRLEKSFMVTAAHFSLCMTAVLAHYQLFGFHLAIPFLLYLWIYLEQWRRSDLVALCLIGPLAVCFAGYLAPLLLTLSGLLLAARFAWRPGALFARLDAHLRLADLLLVLAVAATLYVVAFRPYLMVKNELGPQPFADTVTYSARPESILTNVSTISAFYPRRQPGPGDWERAVFPGATLLIGGVALAVLTFLRGAAGSAPMRRLQAHALALLVSAWVLSLGPYLPQLPALPLPFAWLASVVPGLREVRAPGRLGMFFALPLAIFAVVAIRSAFARHRRTVLAVVLALFIVESWPTYPVFVYAVPHEKTYRVVAARLAAGTPLLELPVFVSDHFGTLGNVTHQLLGSTYHWARLVVGYGAKSTPEYHQLLDLDRQLIQGEIAFAEMLGFARRLGIDYVLVHFDGYPEAARGRIRAQVEATQGLEPLYREGEDLLVRLR